MTEGLDACQHNGQAQWAAAFVCELTQVAMARGRHLDGLDRLHQLRHVDADDPLPACLRRKLDQVEVHCRLGLGDLEGAFFIFNSIPAILQCDETLARLDLCAGRPDRAERRLTAAADRARPLRAEIERLVLLTRAQLQLGKISEADDTLRRALEQGRPQRYFTVFLDDGNHLVAQLRGIAGPLSRHLRVRVGGPGPNGALARASKPPPRCVEPLTVRERDVLRHLPTLPQST